MRARDLTQERARGVRGATRSGPRSALVRGATGRVQARVARVAFPPQRHAAPVLHALERAAFLVDLRRRAEAEAPEDRQRRAPALQRVLEIEALDRDGQREPAAPSGESACEAEQRETRRPGRERALDVPLAVERGEPARNLVGVAPKVRDALLGLP